MQPTAGPLTVDDFHRLGELGVFGEDDRVELLDGQIIFMTPIGSRHAATVDRLSHRLNRLAGDRVIVRAQNPLRLEHHEVYPDVCLVFPRADFYADRNPGPRDTSLVIEVADSSLPYDRDRKVPHYAAAGITEVWLVSLPGDSVMIYRNPANGTYRDIRTAHRGETIAPLAFPDLTVAVSEILG